MYTYANILSEFKAKLNIWYLYANIVNILPFIDADFNDVSMNIKSKCYWHVYENISL